MLSIDLKILEETIAQYSALGGELEKQETEIEGVKTTLLEVWTGQQAVKFEEEFHGLLDGGTYTTNSPNSNPNFLELKTCHQGILEALTNAQIEFSKQKNRCDEFCETLTNTTYDVDEEIGDTVKSGQLAADYEQITTLLTNLDNLICKGPCDKQSAPGGSQISTWWDFCSHFGGGLLHSHFNTSDYYENIDNELFDEFKSLLNFRSSLGIYLQKLQDTEKNLQTLFGVQISDFAKGMDRSIYVVSSGTTVNEQRIAYLSEKSPYAYTPEEMMEMSRLVDYYSTSVDFNKRGTVYRLFRNYCVALNTTGNVLAQPNPDLAKLSSYFMVETKLRLTNSSDGTCNYEALNNLMKTNPKGITEGDLEVLNNMFNHEFAGLDESSMDAANTFLANCFIDGNIGYKGYEAQRSPVFDLWYMEYAKSYEMTDEDKEVLYPDSDSEMAENDSYDIDDSRLKFFKQALLGVVSSDMGINMVEYLGGDNCDKLFYVKDIGLPGQTQLDFQLNFATPYEDLEMEYYAFRTGPDLVARFEENTAKELESFKVSDLEYWSNFEFETGVGIALSKLPGVNETINGLAGNKERIETNEKIDNTLKKRQDALALEAYQIDGQVTYVNGELCVNNGVQDRALLEERLGEFESNLKPANPHYDAFMEKPKFGNSKTDKVKAIAYMTSPALKYVIVPRLEEYAQSKLEEEVEAKVPEGLLGKDRNSPEFIQAYVNYYNLGIGDSDNITGRSHPIEIDQ